MKIQRVVSRRIFMIMSGIILLLLHSLLHSLTPSPMLPDTSEARRAMLDEMVSSSFVTNQRKAVTQQNGDIVIYQTRIQNNKQYYIFLPVSEGTDYDIASQGAYIVRRNSFDNSIEQVKIFLHNDENTYARITPHNQYLVMSVYVSGIPFYQSIPVPMSMEQLLISDFHRVQMNTDGIINWDLLSIDTGQPKYQHVRFIVEQIRQALPSLPDAEDGAMDANGNWVFIEELVLQEGQAGLNCSGFAKWVIDGFYGPAMNTYTKIEALKRKHLSYRGNSWSTLQEGRDPYFGLDWTRNLALHMYALQHNIEDIAGIEPETSDVNTVPVAAYLEDVGFMVDELNSVLYWLAVHEPGTLYIGSVNTDFGANPVLRQHVHVAVFFPYFDDRGKFHVVVMERNVETSITSLSQRYPDSFVHLVRVQPLETFQVPVTTNAVVQ